MSETKVVEGRNVRVIEVDEDLYKILEVIKSRVADYTSNALTNLSNAKASKILAKRIREANLY